MSSLDVVCLGQMVADIVVRPVDGMPPSGKARGVEAIELRSGGCALNTALVLAKLGVRVEAAGTDIGSVEELRAELRGDLVRAHRNEQRRHRQMQRERERLSRPMGLPADGLALN